jgi:hypothetical protein
MHSLWKAMIWGQFGASIDMLQNAIRACPEYLWSDGAEPPKRDASGKVGFWYVAFHTLFFLDLSLFGSVEGFAPPPPFTLDELDPSDRLPERIYTQDELLKYLEYCRGRCREALQALTEEDAVRKCRLPWVELNRGEFLLYNMRHVQHHTGQLNLMLSQAREAAPRWVKQAPDAL